MPPMPSSPLARVPSGIAGLDGLVEGGFVQGSTVLLRGGTGTGKTLASMQYLYHGARDHDEPGIYLSFSESKPAIYQHARVMGWDFERLEKKGKFAFIRYSPHEVEMVLKEGGGTIRDTIESIGAKRLVIDSLTAYSLLFESPYQADESTLSLFDMLRKWGCTTIVTSEAAALPDESDFERLGFLTDAILNIYYVRSEDHRYRALEIVKMRDTIHSEKIHGLAFRREAGATNLVITRPFTTLNQLRPLQPKSHGRRSSHGPNRNR